MVSIFGPKMLKKGLKSVILFVETKNKIIYIYKGHLLIFKKKNGPLT